MLIRFLPGDIRFCSTVDTWVSLSSVALHFERLPWGLPCIALAHTCSRIFSRVRVTNEFFFLVLRRVTNDSFLSSPAGVVVVVVRAAPDNPEMSVPGVGYSFKPKGLAFVTPLYPV